MWFLEYRSLNIKCQSEGENITASLLFLALQIAEAARKWAPRPLISGNGITPEALVAWVVPRPTQRLWGLVDDYRHGIHVCVWHGEYSTHATPPLKSASDLGGVENGISLIYPIGAGRIGGWQFFEAAVFSIALATETRPLVAGRPAEVNVARVFD